MTPLSITRADLTSLRSRIRDVSRKRDLWTATERGAEINRVLSTLDRTESDLSEGQRALLQIARTHVRAMMDCPCRMRLDDTWQDDFVAEATKAVDALISLAEMSEPPRSEPLAPE